jgi:hypothetical protein
MVNNNYAYVYLIARDSKRVKSTKLWKSIIFHYIPIIEIEKFKEFNLYVS